VLLKAIRRRHELLVASATVFEQVDLLLTPTTPTPAFEAEGRLTGELNGETVTLFGLSAAGRWKHRPLVQAGEILNTHLHNLGRKMMESLWRKLDGIHVAQN